MAIHSICRSAARVAAFAAMAVLLFQASCPAQFVAMARIGAISPASSDCHEPAPALPDAPSSEHNCCNGDHYPEALLNAAQAAPPPSAVGVVDQPLFYSARLATRSSETHAAFSRPPGPLPLRI